jgi:hypothetical protein
MYLWDTNKLARSLAQGELTAETKFLYLIYSNILYAASGYLLLYFAVGPSGFTYWFELILVLIITFYGTLRCKKAFAARTDQSLIENFFIIGLPLSIKMFIFVFIAQTFIPILIGLVVRFNLKADSSYAELVVFIVNTIYQDHSLYVTVIATHWFFWRMSFHLAKIADSNSHT